MNRRTFITLIILLLALSNAICFGEDRMKIAVLDFQLQGEGYSTSDMGKIVAEWLTTALVKKGNFEVVERRLLQQILKEQELSMTGVIDESSAAKVGKLLGVKAIISGSISKLGSYMEVNARIIDVESASIIAAERVKGVSLDQLSDRVVQMGSSMAVVDGKVEFNVSELKQKKSSTLTPTEFELIKLDPVIKNIKELKDKNDEHWKTHYIQTKGILDRLYTKEPRNHILLYYYAKLYYAVEVNWRAERALNAALKYKPDYKDALILKEQMK